MKLVSAKVLFIVFSLFFSLPSNAYAALISIEPNGEVVANVLALQDSASKPSKKESLEVVTLPSDIKPPASALISLIKEGDTVLLQVKTSSGESRTDVTSYEDEIIAIEQKDQAKRISISKKDENFVIKQDNISALTLFPITINSKEKKVEVSTATGDRFIEIYPADAYGTIHNANLFDTLSSNSSVVLTESDKGELQYVLQGEKNVTLLNLFTLNAPVEVSISAIDGGVINIQRPTWLKILGFLLDSR